MGVDPFERSAHPAQRDADGREERGRTRRDARPTLDLRFTKLAESNLVLVGMVGDGYVRLTPAQAVERAFTLLHLAGVEQDTLDVYRAMLPEL